MNKTSVAATTETRRGPVRGRSQRAQQLIFIGSVLAPMFLIFLLFWIYPLVRGVWGSFTLWRAFNPEAPFVGLRHYQTLLNDPIFLKALQNTFYFALL